MNDNNAADDDDSLSFGLGLVKSHLMKMVTMTMDDNNADDDDRLITIINKWENRITMLMTMTGMHCTAAPRSW